MASIDDYLETDYSPDREFVDGTVVERNLGERPHSRAWGNVIFSLCSRTPRLFIWPSQRVRTILNRCRVPGVCVTEQEPPTDVFETPPLICVEILSRRDEMSDVLERLEEQAAAGVRYIWVVDPRRKKAFFYDGGLREVTSGVLVTADEPVVELPLADVFGQLQRYGTAAYSVYKLSGQHGTNATGRATQLAKTLASQIAAFCEAAGFRRARNVAGGIPAWSNEADPRAPQHENREAGQLT